MGKAKKNEIRPTDNPVDRSADLYDIVNVSGVDIQTNIGVDLAPGETKTITRLTFDHLPIWVHSYIKFYEHKEDTDGDISDKRDSDIEPGDSV